MRAARRAGAAAVLAGCGGPAAKSTYTGKDVKAAYYKASDEGAGARAFEDYWVDDDYHSHANYVPREALETCPLMQRANAPTQADQRHHAQRRGAGRRSSWSAPSARTTTAHALDHAGRAGVRHERDRRVTGMDAVGSAMSKCPATYEVRGGPSPILGTYSVSARPFESGGWKGVVQQIAHTRPRDDVYYEDTAHVVVQRANVILYLDVTHQQDHRGARRTRPPRPSPSCARWSSASDEGAGARPAGRAGVAGGAARRGGRARDDRPRRRRPIVRSWPSSRAR